MITWRVWLELATAILVVAFFISAIILGLFYLWERTHGNR